MRTMLRTLGIILSLRNTININEILSGIRHIPIVGKKIPARVHGVRIIKILAMIPSVITELFKAFFGPLCLFGFLFVSSATLGSLRLYESRSVYLYLFLIISLMGVFFNNNFRFSTEVKYAVFYMGMDAKKYVLARFLYQVITVALGHTFLGIPTALLAKLPWYLAILLPVAGVGLKAATLGVQMAVYAAKQAAGRKMTKKGMPVSIEGNATLNAVIFSIVFIAGILVMPLFFYFNLYPLSVVLYVLMAIALIPGIILIRKFPYGLYRTALYAEQSRYEITKEKTKKETRLHGDVKFSRNTDVQVKAHGYRFLNELFLARHKKVFLTRMIVTTACVVVAIVLIGVFLRYELKIGMPSESIVRYIFSKHPGAFIFLLYCINTGSYMAHAMYANCDASLLSFGFYKTPKALRKMFRLRTVSVVKYNLLPAAIFAVFTVVVLAFTGGEEYLFQYLWNILLIFLSVVFFSVRHLALYYLMQPYSEEMTLKSWWYSFLSFLMGGFCMLIMILPLSARVLVLAGLVLTALYIFLSDLLVYKLSPRTFR